MKTYKKPEFRAEIIEEYHEPVFLDGSSWFANDCYYAYVTNLNKQSKFEDGRYYWTFQLNARHDATVHGRTHTNNNQYIIVTFSEGLSPNITGVTINGATAELGYERTKARALTSYMQNPWDNIGLGNFHITFNVDSSLSLAEANALVAGISLTTDLYEQVVVNDTPFRIYS